jgi:hypothetical protein
MRCRLHRAEVIPFWEDRPVPTSKTGFVTLALAASLTLSACGAAAPISAPVASVSSSVSVAPKPATMTLDASAVTKALLGKIGTASLVKVYTAEDDPNSLLGRPNGYASKTAFADSRVPASKSAGKEADALERGGSVEVYSTPEDAKSRSAYIQAALKNVGFLGTEYHFLRGGALVRVTGNLTPAQAAVYKEALASI